MPTRNCPECNRSFSNNNPKILDRILKMHTTRMHITAPKRSDYIAYYNNDQENDQENDKLSIVELKLLLEQEQKKNKLLNEILTRILMEL